MFFSKKSLQFYVIFAASTYADVSYGIIVTQMKPWLRVDSGLSHMQVSADGRRIAYVESDSGALSVLDTKTKAVSLVSQYQVGSSFVFAPDSCRLFFRELAKDAASNQPISKIKAYDCRLKSSVEIKRLEGFSGFLAYEPRTQELNLISESGNIIRHKIEYPDHKLARWLGKQNLYSGSWIPTPGKILWLSSGSQKLQPLDDDGSGVASYSISPDGSSIAWASVAGRVFISDRGGKSTDLGEGKDPQWHPKAKKIVYSSPHRMASVITDYDLRLADKNGPGKYLTRTQDGVERWPVWDPKSDRILFTQEKSTDIFTLSVNDL